MLETQIFAQEHSLHERTWYYLMPGSGYNLCSVVWPRNLGNGISLNAAFKHQPLAVVFLTNSRLARKSRRFAIHLPGKIKVGVIKKFKIMIYLSLYLNIVLPILISFCNVDRLEVNNKTNFLILKPMLPNFYLLMHYVEYLWLASQQFAICYWKRNVH